MTEVEAQLAAHRAAVDEFNAAIRALDDDQWRAPRAPVAWSPAQIAEHLALITEFNGRVATGVEPSPIPRLLRPLVQPIARRFVVTSTLAAGRFTRKGRAPAMFQPAAASSSRDAAIARLAAAVMRFEAAIRSRHPEARHSIVHPIFGAIALADWVRLQAIHVRHHRAQLTLPESLIADR